MPTEVKEPEGGQGRAPPASLQLVLHSKSPDAVGELQLFFLLGGQVARCDSKGLIPLLLQHLPSLELHVVPSEHMSSSSANGGKMTPGNGILVQVLYGVDHVHPSGLAAARTSAVLVGFTEQAQILFSVEEGF